MADQQQPRSVPVHVTGTDPGVQLGGGGRGGYRSVYHTVTLTAGEGAQPILNASDQREIAWVTAIDAAVWIADNLSDASNGAGAYLPCVTPSTGEPSLGSPHPIEDNGPVYVGAVAALTGSSTARVSIIAVYRR